MPILRTPPHSHRTPRPQHWLLAWAVGLAAVPAVGWTGLAALSGPLASADLGHIGALPARLVLIPAFGALQGSAGAMALVAGLALALLALALRVGWAGWLTALAAGTLAGAMSALVVPALAGPSALVSGGVTALVAWATLRLTCPEALCRPGRDD